MAVDGYGQAIYAVLCDRIDFAFTFADWWAVCADEIAGCICTPCLPFLAQAHTPLHSSHSPCLLCLLSLLFCPPLLFVCFLCVRAKTILSLFGSFLRVISPVLMLCGTSRAQHSVLLLAINPVIPGCGKGADENPSTFTQPTFSAPAL